MKALVTLASLLALLATGVESSSIDGVAPAPAFYAFTLDGAAPASGTPSEDPASPATPGDLAAALVMLSLFLALIAGNLLRWSGEPWKVEKVR
jgi:hypothetical protein